MKKFTLLTALCLALGITTLHAQEATLPTSDAKALAMGGLQMTAQSSSHAIYNNPALAAFSLNPFLVSSSYYHQDQDDAYSVSGSYRVSPSSVIQAGWRQYLHDDVNGRDSHENVLDLGFAHSINSKWSFGVVGRYLHRLCPDGQKVDAAAVDLSAAYLLPIENFGSQTTLRSGAKISNLGGYLKSTSYTLPMNLSVGTALDTFITDEHEFTVGVDMSYYFYPKPVRGFLMSVGAEYNFMQLIQVRGGYHYGERDSYYPSYASVGCGVRFLHLRLDFAYLFADEDTPFHNTYSLSFGFDF